MFESLSQEHVRAYIYRIVTPLGALLVFYGILGEEELSLLSTLAGTILFVGDGALAMRNTSTKRQPQDVSQESLQEFFHFEEDDANE